MDPPGRKEPRASDAEKAEPVPPARDAPSPTEDCDFSPVDWVALFPAPTTPLLTLSRAETAQQEWDEGEDYRDSHPATLESVLAAFSNPFLRAFLYLGASRKVATQGWKNSLAACVLAAAMLGLQAVAAAWGTFGAARVAAGLVPFAVLSVARAATFVLRGMAMPTAPRTLDRSAPAGLFRWLELAGLARDSGKPAARSQLVEHWPADELCPCADCVGDVQQFAAWMVGLDALFFTVVGWLSFLTAVWTSLVTFAPRFWTTWWCCILGAVFALTAFVYVLDIFGRVCNIRNLAFTKLAIRMHRRAAAVALRSMLDALLGGRGTGTAQRRWLYVRLHARFLALLRDRAKQDQATLTNGIMLVILPGVVLAIVANVAVGSCIPAYLLFWAVLALSVSLVNAVNLASGNALVSAVSSAYAEAQRALRTAGLQLPPGDPLAAELERHDRALASFRDLDGYTARLLGFPISYGAVRTVLATLLTLGVALWSVFRGLGVFVALESFCPPA